VAKQKDETHVVAIALDDHMAYAFFVLVHSLVTTAQAPFHLIIGHFSGRLSPANIEAMKRFLATQGLTYEIRELTPHPLFTERRHLTITTFSKFVISDAVTSAHLWVDLDTVARNGWDDIFSSIHGADQGVPLVVAAKIDSPHTRFEGFNAGVLGWTREKRKPWIDALQSLPEKRFSSEQYLFNTLYSDNNVVVDSRFNFLSSWHAHAVERNRASIIHYSGPIKPWHLARRHRRAWLTINPTWESWFEAEEQLLSSIQPSMAAELRALARRALTSGRLHTGKGALAGWFMRFLAYGGALGDPLVYFLKSRAQR
jgi:lipopolysaccharide biosynthesis glycosyltransferase